MDVSIITPSYNYGRFIGECLQSVACQAGVSFEHIVIDAGSTDSTRDVVADYPHVQFFQEPDDGMSDAINKGFRRAKGKWVMWLNADDQLLPGALKKVVGWADQHPEADVIYGGWNFTDSEGRITKSIMPPAFDLLMLVHYGCYIGSTACFYKKSTVIDPGHLLNPRFQVSMDGEYYSRLGRLGMRFSKCNSYLANFRMHGQNISRKNRSAEGIDGQLDYQRQLAESVTIRRAYGWTLFGQDHPVLNSIPDAILWGLFRVKMGIVKLCYRLFRG